MAKFCSECGHGLQPTDKFCGGCGRRLDQTGGGAPPAVAVQGALEPARDWSHEHRYEVLKVIPEIRDRIARATARAPSIWSAEEMLDTAASIGGTKMGAKVGHAISGVMRSAGVKTRSTEVDFIDAPIGVAIVRALCNMAANGRKLKQVTQLGDGVLIEAEIPSDMLNFAGLLTVTLIRDAVGTRLEAEAYWPGEFWVVGKDKKAFAGLRIDLRADSV